MNSWLKTGAFLMVAVIAGFAGYYFNQAGLNSRATEAATQKLLLAPLTDLNGKPQTLSQRRGKVLVINFWATWCTPCRKEIPALMRVQKKYLANAVEIVGISFETAAKVLEYADEMNIGYSLLIGGVETLVMSNDLGNQAGVLPFTLILDRAGIVAYAHAGALTEPALDAVLMPLL